MKNYLFLFLFFCLKTFAQDLTSTQLARVYNQNYVTTNPGAEKYISGWTASGGSTSTSTTVYKSGTSSFSWAFQNATTLTFPSFTIPAGGLGSCVAEFWFMSSANVAATFVVQTGGTSVSSVYTMPALVTTQWQKVSLPFVCTATAATDYNILGTGSGNNGFVFIDDYFGGTNINVGTVAQAQFIGSAYIPTTASCTWSRTSTSLGAFSTVSACPGPTVELNPGNAVIQTTDTDLPRFTVNNLAPGNYLVHFILPNSISTSAQFAAAAIYDGTNTRGQAPINGNTAGAASSHIVAPFSYTAAGNVTFELYTSSAANALNVDLSAGNQRLYFYIEKLPSQTESATRLDAPGVNWTAFTPTGSWTANTTYTGFYQCSNNNLSVIARVATSGAPTATNLTVNLPSGYTIDTTRLVYTGSDGILPIQSAQAIDSGVDNFVGVTHYNNTTSVSPKVIRTVSGTNPVFVDPPSITQTTPFTFGSGDSVNLTYTVPVTADSPCPKNSGVFIPGSVYSASTGLEVVNRALVRGSTANTACSSTPCTIASQTGSWLSSVTRASAGTYTINFASSYFSAAPQCVINGAVNSTYQCQTDTEASTSTQNVVCVNGSGTATDNFFNVICMGPKL